MSAGIAKVEIRKSEDEYYMTIEGLAGQCPQCDAIIEAGTRLQLTYESCKGIRESIDRAIREMEEKMKDNFSKEHRN